MRDLAVLLIHLIATVAKLLLPSGARSIIAESLLLNGREREPQIYDRSTESLPAYAQT